MWNHSNRITKANDGGKNAERQIEWQAARARKENQI